MTKATRPASITCAHCGKRKPLGQRGPVPIYCSGPCRTANKRTPTLINCAHCGATASVRANTAYCSAVCRNAANHQAARLDGRYNEQLRAAKATRREQSETNAKPCPYCGTPMHPRRKQCGKPDCKRAFNADRARQWHQDFTGREGKRYSSKYREREREYEAQRRSERPHWRTMYPEAAALADARRRMLVEQATKGEPFAPRDVYERDQWTCGLCRRPVDPLLPWPDPMSASVDHIVPLSRGGEHSLDNAQCAHLSCNCRKGDRTIEEIAEVESITNGLIVEG